MYKKLLLAISALTLSGNLCLAQTPKQSPPIMRHWITDPITFSLHTLPFQDFTTPTQVDRPLHINWRLAELVLRLSDLRRGTSLKSVVQRIAILGGREDGGLQSIPATRYYFNPGINVEVPVKNGVLTGPVRIFPGAFHCD